MLTVIIICVGLQIIHYIADYVTPSMAMITAKKYGRPVLPIFEHAYHHGMFVAAFLLVVGLAIGLSDNSIAIWSGMFTMSTHFLIDLLKGRLTKRFSSIDGFDKKGYWVYMGFDQLLHQIVIIMITTVWMSHVKI